MARVISATVGCRCACGFVLARVSAVASATHHDVGGGLDVVDEISVAASEFEASHVCQAPTEPPPASGVRVVLVRQPSSGPEIVAVTNAGEE